MRIKLASVPVHDQTTALHFYTDVLGFVTKMDVPAGEYRWITVVAPEGPDDLQLALEPGISPLVQTYQAGLKEQGIPFTVFFVDDLASEYERLRDRGVVFTQEPIETEWGSTAMFDDTCGNLIMLQQE